MAGSEFTLICSIIEVISGLTNVPTAMWMADGEPVTSGGDITIAMSALAPTAAAATLTIDPLRASHGKIYCCVGDLVSPAQEYSIQVTSDELLTVQSKLYSYSNMQYIYCSHVMWYIYMHV